MLNSYANCRENERDCIHKGSWWLLDWNLRSEYNCKCGRSGFLNESITLGNHFYNIPFCLSYVVVYYSFPDRRWVGFSIHLGLADYGESESNIWYGLTDRLHLHHSWHREENRLVMLVEHFLYSIWNPQISWGKSNQCSNVIAMMGVASCADLSLF